MEKLICTKCSGKGNISAYSHVKSGVCFRCWGTGHDLRAEKTALQAAVNALRQEYRKVQAALKTASGCRKQELEKLLAALADKGKRGVKAIERLDAEIKALALRVNATTGTQLAAFL